MLDKIGVPVLTNLRITGKGYCGQCKHFPGDGMRCEKVGEIVYSNYLCYNSSWKLKIVKYDEEIEVKPQAVVVFTIINKEPYFIIAEPIFPFEPKEEGL